MWLRNRALQWTCIHYALRAGKTRVSCSNQKGDKYKVNACLRVNQQSWDACTHAPFTVNPGVCAIANARVLCLPTKQPGSSATTRALMIELRENLTFFQKKTKKKDFSWKLFRWYKRTNGPRLCELLPVNNYRSVEFICILRIFNLIPERELLVGNAMNQCLRKMHSQIYTMGNILETIFFGLITVSGIRKSTCGIRHVFCWNESIYATLEFIKISAILEPLFKFKRENVNMQPGKQCRIYCAPLEVKNDLVRNF